MLITFIVETRIQFDTESDDASRLSEIERCVEEGSQYGESKLANVEVKP